MHYFKKLIKKKLVNSLSIQYKPRISGNPYVKKVKRWGKQWCYENVYYGSKEFIFKVKVKDKNGEEKQLDLQYLTYNKFDKTKKTVIILHDDYIPSFNSHLKPDADCNYLLMQYLPHRYPTLMKDYNVNLGFMVDTSSQMIDQLEGVLASDEYYGKEYKRNEQLILNADALGAIIAVKLAAKKAKSAQPNERIFNAILNHSCPVNVAQLIKRNIFPYIAIASLVAVLVSFVVVYPISIAGLYAKNHNLSAAAKFALIPATIVLYLILITITIVSFVLINEGKRVCITKEDVGALKNEAMIFVRYEGNIFAPFSFNKQIVSLFYENLRASTKFLSLKKEGIILKTIHEKDVFIHELDVIATIDAVFNKDASILEGKYYTQVSWSNICFLASCELDFSIMIKNEPTEVARASINDEEQLAERNLESVTSTQLLPDEVEQYSEIG